MKPRRLPHLKAMPDYELHCRDWRRLRRIWHRRSPELSIRFREDIHA